MTIEAMRKRHEKNAKLGERAANDILDYGLADSTWKELYPEAYKDLLTYRSDIAGSIEKTLNRSRLV